MTFGIVERITLFNKMERTVIFFYTLLYRRTSFDRLTVNSLDDFIIFFLLQ